VSAGPAQVDRTLTALADPHRRRVIDLLSRGPRSAGELAAEVALSAPAMSRHLRALRQSRLVDEASAPHDARVRIYRLRPEPMAELKAWLEAAERLWAEQLLAFKTHIEGAAGEGG
jgi:DNA-binding transcriptional ArsR family regulator